MGNNIYDELLEQMDSYILNALAHSSLTVYEITSSLDGFLDRYHISPLSVANRVNELQLDCLIACICQKSDPNRSFFALRISVDDLPMFNLDDQMIDKLCDALALSPVSASNEKIYLTDDFGDGKPTLHIFEDNLEIFEIEDAEEFTELAAEADAADTDESEVESETDIAIDESLTEQETDTDAQYSTENAADDQENEDDSAQIEEESPVEVEEPAETEEDSIAAEDAAKDVDEDDSSEFQEDSNVECEEISDELPAEAEQVEEVFAESDEEEIKKEPFEEAADDINKDETEIEEAAQDEEQPALPSDDEQEEVQEETDEEAISDEEYNPADEALYAAEDETAEEAQVTDEDESAYDEAASEYEPPYSYEPFKQTETVCEDERESDDNDEEEPAKVAEEVLDEQFDDMAEEASYAVESDQTEAVEEESEDEQVIAAENSEEHEEDGDEPPFVVENTDNTDEDEICAEIVDENADVEDESIETESAEQPVDERDEAAEEDITEEYNETDELEAVVEDEETPTAVETESAYEPTSTVMDEYVLFGEPSQDTAEEPAQETTDEEYPVVPEAERTYIEETKEPVVASERTEEPAEQESRADDADSETQEEAQTDETPSDVEATLPSEQAEAQPESTYDEAVVEANSSLPEEESDKPIAAPVKEDKKARQKGRKGRKNEERVIAEEEEADTFALYEQSQETAQAEPEPIKRRTAFSRADIRQELEENPEMHEKRLASMRLLGLIEDDKTEEPQEPEEEVPEVKEEEISPKRESYSAIFTPQTELEIYLQQEETEKHLSYKTILHNLFNSSNAPKQQEDVDSKITMKECGSLSEFREEMRKKGYDVRQYVVQHTVQYYSQKYINVNSIRFATSCLVYLVAVALILIGYFVCDKYAGLGFMPYLCTGIVLFLIPCYCGVRYLAYKDRHAPATFSFKLSFATSFMVALILMMIFLLIAFFNPKSGANISEINTLIAPVFYPAAMLLLLPVWVIVYALLYRTRKFYVI